MGQLSAEISAMAQKGASAALQALSLNAEQRNDILMSMAMTLEQRKSQVQDENAKDLKAGKEAGLSSAMLDRLELNDARYGEMVQGLRDLVELEDLIGSEISSNVRPNGLEITRVRVPIGLIGMIYESRPNVTADAAGLCVKTSNAVILRGGSEAYHSNRAIAAALCEGGEDAGLPEGMVQFVDTTDRDAVKELVQQEGLVDLVIPRGGESLIRAVAAMARVPVLKHYNGICHTYVDESADLSMAIAISENAKCQRPGVCNAMETLLVHEDVAQYFLPLVCERLVARGVELRGDDRSRAIVPAISAANESDWSAEYLDMILAIRVVPSLEEAVVHINTYGSRHTDAIIAESRRAQENFTRNVDSGVLMVNASTRFNDGAQFGLGAEIGISTDKLHARGPVGPEGLTTYKYVVKGEGQIRE